MLYGADVGGTNGGQVEVISKSGTNGYHGSAFEYLRNDVLNTRGPFGGSTLPPLRLNQFGSSLGGRIIKNRTFFFLAYEGLRQRLGTTLIGNVPSNSFRATVLAQSPALAPIINSYPLGNRALSSTTSQYVSVASLSSNQDSGLIRIDHRISDSTNFYARYNIDQVFLTSPSGNLLDHSQTSTAAETWGNAGRNLIRGPAFWQADAALSRDFRLTERFIAAVRIEGFDIFNRAQYGNPNGNLSSASFGRITTTVNGTSPTGSGTPREFQVALRLKF
jgi:hypothetical protein